MIRVGFSTHKGNVLSSLIRWITGSSASHAWLLVDDTYFGMEMVMEATETGFRLIPYTNFKAEGNEIVVLIEPSHSLEVGVKEAARWLGESYDFAGLFGAAWVMLGRRLRRKWRNWAASPHSMFCSEAVVRVMQAAKYPGADALDPEATSPQDLLDFFAHAGAVPMHMMRARKRLR